MKISVIKFVRDKLMAANKLYEEKSSDHYNFWEQHVKLVVKEALNLADEYGADKEIVELGALLHDIALVMEVGTKADHNKNGKEIARQILEEYGYPDDRKERVLGCVLHHRSSQYAENLEELCVGDADILAHSDNIPMCFGFVYKYNTINTRSIDEWIQYWR